MSNSSKDGPFFGRLGRQSFLRKHWQKKPLLVRNAFPGFEEPFTAREFLGLARREDAESRLVRRAGNSWLLDHGPFPASRLNKLPARDWAVLVQDTQHFSRAAEALRQCFSFLPHARVDDLMVSFAKAGGGVGPHYDSYDVFIIQGTGRRRWSVSAQRDLALLPGLPLKIIARYEPDQEWILEKGDMLYLPPGYAHDGVALEDCLNYSVGFRAPSTQELGTAFLDFLRDEIELPGQYGDPGLRPTSAAGRIPDAMRRELRKSLRRIRFSGTLMDRFIGCFLSEPKPSVIFSPPRRPLSHAAFARGVAAHGVALDARTRMLYCGAHFYINGAAVAVPARDVRLFRELADCRALGQITAAADSVDLLNDWYRCGYLTLDRQVTA